MKKANILIAVLMSLVANASCYESSSLLRFGTYTVAKGAGGATSLDNLVQMDECIKRNDRACETAMLLDGRAFFVETGTLIDGSEMVDGVFDGDVRSGALVGKHIYLPVGAVRVAVSNH